jgi:hypothetical protein
MSAEALFNYIQNEKHLYDAVRLRVEGLRDTIDSAARNLAKANAEWHDDPDADDHAEFHAPADTQFPQAMRDEAVLDLVKRHLEICNENERARV